jgi:hypothetical protein
MNAKDVKKYWNNKYFELKNEPYKTDKYIVELVLFKKLLDKYGQDVVVEAIDQFFNAGAKPLSALYFASSKVFPEKFSGIIKQAPILKYKSITRSSSEARELVQEYQDYMNSFTLSDEEKVCKNIILKRLEEIYEQSPKIPR